MTIKGQLQHVAISSDN